jgi:predicted CoA-binding protein
LIVGQEFKTSVGRRDPASIIAEARTVAVVGLSANPDKPSNEVARYLKLRGYRVIPVNPKEERLLGERAYPSVADIPERVDVVDVFLRPERVPDVARDAVRAGAKTLWLQQGIVSPEARRIAEENGLDYVEDRCAMKTLQGTSPQEQARL